MLSLYLKGSCNPRWVSQCLLRTQYVGLFRLSHKMVIQQRQFSIKFPFSKTSQTEVVDSKHFFTKQDTEANQNHEFTTIGEAIRQQRNRRRRQTTIIILTLASSFLIGYGLGYKVLYLREEIFYPLYPASKYHKLSRTELLKIDTQQIEYLSRIRVLEKLA